eukprot:6816195-Prymnesium_polylepis.1
MRSHWHRPMLPSRRRRRVRAPVPFVSPAHPPASAGTFPGNGFIRASATMPTCADAMATSDNSTAAGMWGSSNGKALGRLPELVPACTPTRRSASSSTARMQIA